jgi:hypothetical protein
MGGLWKTCSVLRHASILAAQPPSAGPLLCLLLPGGGPWGNHVHTRCRRWHGALKAGPPHPAPCRRAAGPAGGGAGVSHGPHGGDGGRAAGAAGAHAGGLCGAAGVRRAGRGGPRVWSGRAFFARSALTPCLLGRTVPLLSCSRWGGGHRGCKAEQLQGYNGQPLAVSAAAAHHDSHPYERKCGGQ